MSALLIFRLSGLIVLAFAMVPSVSAGQLLAPFKARRM